MGSNKLRIGTLFLYFMMSKLFSSERVNSDAAPNVESGDLTANSSSKGSRYVWLLFINLLKFLIKFLISGIHSKLRSKPTEHMFSALYVYAQRF